MHVEPLHIHIREDDTREHFFSARSGAAIVDGDATVEKLNRSDGNSQLHT